MSQEVLGLIAEDLSALEQAAQACERRIMGQEKVPVAEKIISLSDADASFIVKRRMEHHSGLPPAIGTQRAWFCHGPFLTLG
jgi:hypothetical protein